MRRVAPFQHLQALPFHKIILFCSVASSLNYELLNSYKVIPAPFIAQLRPPTFSETQRPLKAKNRVIEGWQANFAK